MFKFKIKGKPSTYGKYVRTMPKGDPNEGQHWCDRCRRWTEHPEVHLHEDER